MSTTTTTPTLSTTPSGSHRATTPPEAAAVPRRSVVRDTVVVMLRELRPVRRDPFSLLFGMIQPLVFLGLFGPLLAGSVGGGALGENVWQWFVPAILVQVALFGTSTVGANLLMELQTGSHERMLVSPLSRPSMLVGRSLKEMVPLAAQAVVVIAVMTPTSFDLHPVGALVGLALLAVLGVGLGSLSYALALAVRRQDWMFWAVQQTVIFPLMLLSGLLLPLEAGPGWMRAVAAVNPLRYVVDAERALFAGQVGVADVAWGWVAALVTAAVGLAVGIRVMVRSSD